mgnify:CR=1 FL=1
MQFLQFLDRLIPYDTFLNDLAARIVKYLRSDNADPEFVSQRKAYEMFGRRNVERWRRQGKGIQDGRPTPPATHGSGLFRRYFFRYKHK